MLLTALHEHRDTGRDRAEDERRSGSYTDGDGAEEDDESESDRPETGLDAVIDTRWPQVHVAAA